MTHLPTNSAASVSTSWSVPATDSTVGDFFVLLKPRVMTLVVFTGLAGLLAAPVSLPPVLAFTALLCLGLGAGAAGAFNMWYERTLDAKMTRTASRPLPQGRIHPDNALAFAIILGLLSLGMMGLSLNWIAAAMLAFSMFFYAVVYTVWLKPRTPQNIVIGGAAGAFPPVIMWAAATGQTAVLPWLLFLIVFLWTPPHFWALALYKETEYAKAGLPMLPNVRGHRHTRHQILFYTIVLVTASLLPWGLTLLGSLYGLTAATMGGLYLICVARLWRSGQAALARQAFGFSIFYLFALFAGVIADVTLYKGF